MKKNEAIAALAEAIRRLSRSADDIRLSQTDNPVSSIQEALAALNIESLNIEDNYVVVWDAAQTTT